MLICDTDSKIIRQELQDIENAFKIINGVNGEELDGFTHDEKSIMSKLSSKEHLHEYIK